MVLTSSGTISFHTDCVSFKVFCDVSEIIVNDVELEIFMKFISPNLYASTAAQINRYSYSSGAKSECNFDIVAFEYHNVSQPRASTNLGTSCMIKECYGKEAFPDFPLHHLDVLVMVFPLLLGQKVFTQTSSVIF